MPKLPKLKGKELIKILAVHAEETLGPGLLLQILKDTELDRSNLFVK